MLQGSQIDEVIALLEARRVHLYHACQYQDFVSYLNIEGIPSRARLEEDQHTFTQFETDTNDHDNGVWDKVFVNLSDFGTTFANGGSGVPNPYGPILIVLHPSALRDVDDVAICLKSAGTDGFDRERESLKSVQDVDRLFAQPIEAGYPASAWVKYKKALGETFNYPNPADPEVSCTVAEGALSLKHTDKIVVDPYILGGRPLSTWVKDAMQEHNLKFPVQDRTPKVGAERYNELATLLRQGLPTLIQFQDLDTTDQLKNWAQGCLAYKLDYQFRRFANYFRDGTLFPLEADQGQ